MELILIGNIQTDLEDLYYTKESVDDLLAAKADENHEHNEVYYTKFEIDELLGE